MEGQDIGLAQEVREWVLSSPGDFASSLVAIELGLSSSANRKNLSKILSRLGKDGLIERVGNRRGQFRVINRHEETIDWRKADAGESLDLHWPLELEQRFEVMPGSVVMAAGESNSGKTALLLDVARRDLQTMPTTYFASSNEVNARPLRKRLELFNEPLSHWDAMQAVSRAGDFQEVERPSGLNLIDYLEAHTGFYEIGGRIAQIASKRNDGVAVITLQKNPGADFGRGGAMTLDKATAYLSLHRGDLDKQEPHTLKLPKIKYPLVDYAPKPARFKLVGGYLFIRA